MNASRKSETRNAKKPRRSAIAGVVAAVAVLLPSTALAAEAPTATSRTPLKNPQALSARVQLKGWGFADNPAIYRADMTGDAGVAGLVNATVDADLTTPTVLGREGARARLLYKPARYTFTAADGTFFGDSPSVLTVV